MSSVYRFIYDSEMDKGATEWPEASTIEARHYFDSGVTWVKVLYQFCKFLENSGYEGVRHRIIIKDPYCIEDAFSCGFELQQPKEEIEDEEEEDTQ